MKSVPVERKCEYCGCPESTAVNAGVKCNMTPGKPLHSFQEKSVPVESTCGCKESSCKDDCSRNHTHKTFSCNECSVPIEKWEKEFDEKFPMTTCRVREQLKMIFPETNPEPEKTATQISLEQNQENLRNSIKAFISQAIQAARIEAVEEYKRKNGM